MRLSQGSDLSLRLSMTYMRVACTATWQQHHDSMHRQQVALHAPPLPQLPIQLSLQQQQPKYDWQQLYPAGQSLNASSVFRRMTY